MLRAPGGVSGGGGGCWSLSRGLKSPPGVSAQAPLLWPPESGQSGDGPEEKRL